MLNFIKTQRLILIPITIKLMDCFSDRIIFVQNDTFTLHQGWPTPDTYDIMPIVKAALERQGGPTGFEFWMIVDHESQMVIGDIGFHGPPDEEGSVEIGFGLVEDYRGRGYGFEALCALFDWLKQKEEVKVIEANCLIDNEPSKKILQKARLIEVNRNANFIFWAKQNRP